MKSQNPAIEFLEHFESQSVITLQFLVQSYAKHVLLASDAYRFPVDLEKVFERYGLNVSHVPLLGQRGALTPDLRILINYSDKPEVQKFSLGHELMEILISAIRENDLTCLAEESIIELIGPKKELWCEIGAAELVLPQALFTPKVKEYGISMKSAQILAQLGGTSLIATIRQMLKTDVRVCALVIWYLGHKPTEFVPSKVGQTTYFEDMDPEKKFRVETAYWTKSCKHIKRFKSVNHDSVIGRAYKAPTGNHICGFTNLEITSKRGNYWVEAMPIKYGEENRVLSLIFFDHESDYPDVYA